MLRLKPIIPNTITSLNIVCGSLSVIFAFEGNIAVSGYLILIAAIFDFLDGLTARLLNAYSELGKQLDSLADMISFGLAPTIIAYHIMKSCVHINSLYAINWENSKIYYVFAIVLIAVFSGLRLAKFNIDTRQTNNFIGLPTPANALFFASIPIISSYNPFDPFLFLIYNPNVFLIIIITTSLLLVSPIPMFSLKFKNLKIKENLIRYIFIGLALLVIILSCIESKKVLSILVHNGQIAEFSNEILYIIAKSVPLIIIVYVFLSIINASIIKIKKR